MRLDVAKLEIIHYPDPRLRQRAAELHHFDAQVAAVIERMTELMHEFEGVGLAAPQVGLSWRLFVCQPNAETPPAAYVNPVLVLGDGDITAEEGCLSIPDVNVQVRRASTCELRALDPVGRPVQARAEGLLARIWQHEVDHLDGRLIIDYQNEAEKIANRKLLKELEQKFRKLGGKGARR